MILEIVLIGILTLMTWWIPIIGPFLSAFISTYLTRTGIIKGFLTGFVGGMSTILFIIATLNIMNDPFLNSLGILLNILNGWGTTLISINILIFTSIGGGLGGYIGINKKIKKIKQK